MPVTDRPARISTILMDPAVRLAGYYGLLGGSFYFMGLRFPWFRRFILPNQPVTGSTDLGDIARASSGIPDGPYSEVVAETAAGGVIALTAAMLFAFPVMWMYTITMRQEGYEKSFVRMLILLPLVVAGVVRVVRGDLALAFALAGIVAAVRFRTTLRDLENAVYAFAAIGIGLAAGTGFFTLAGALSTIFAYSVYLIWRLHVGEVETSLELHGVGAPSLAEALVPGEDQKALVIGDRDAVTPVQTAEHQELDAAIERLARYVRGDALRKKGKYNTLLIGYCAPGDVGTAKGKLAQVLEDHAERCVHVDELRTVDSDLVALVYLMRLKKEVEVGAMIDALDADDGSVIRAAELKPVKGLRKRIT